MSGRRALVLTASTQAAGGIYADTAGPILAAGLAELGFTVAGPYVVPDGEQFERALRAAIRAGYDVLLTTGGTGLSARDLTPDLTRRVLDREVPGVGGRSYGRCYISIMVEAIRIEVPSDRSAAERSAVSLTVLQAVADPIRWTVLTALAEEARCVCRLQEHVPIAANLLSYHLKVLREAGLVTSSRRGRWIDYALAPDAMERMRAALPGAVVAGAVTA